MSITPDTIGPDGPPLSTEGWEAGVKEMSSDELRAALRQARKDGAEMRRQRDLAVKLRDRLLAERDAAVARADTVEDTNLTLLGQLEDMRAALATAEALDRSQVDGRWTAIWDRCG